MVRSVRLREAADRLDHLDGHAHVSGMLVRQVVGVNDLWSGRLKDQRQVFHRAFVGPLLDGGAGIVKKHLRRVFTHRRRLLLLLNAHDLHLLIGKLRVEVCAG